MLYKSAIGNFSYIPPVFKTAELSKGRLELGWTLIVVAVSSFHGRHSDTPVQMSGGTVGRQLQHAIRHMERCLHGM